MTVSELGEFELIEQLLQELGPQPDRVGLGSRVTLQAGDDCAALAPAPGVEILSTTDTMVRGIHFLETMPPADLGWKSLATNISDIAAMGGVPASALVTLAIPGDLPVQWLREWYRGMGECARAYTAAIAGGDVVRTKADVCITVALQGEVESGCAAPRSGARPGDALIVTGAPGDSAAGLALFLAGEMPAERLRRAHLRPEPRVPEGRAAARVGGVHAMMDLSDGLAGDLGHLCQASGVGALVEESRLPLSAELREAAAKLHLNPVDVALAGGEDYELLLAVDPAAVHAALQALAAPGRTHGVVIGFVTDPDRGLQRIDSAGRSRPLGRSFTHF